MTLDRRWKLVGVLTVVLLVLGLVFAYLGFLPAPWTDDHGTVKIVDDGTTKATVDVEVADTWLERYTGLSDHESLESGDGMLFVYGNEGDRTFVMRNMDFDIDIVFVGSDGEITSIHHARAPEAGEDGEDMTYPGRGKWVLEVPRGYANETRIDVGDELEIVETR